jgi:hypothetical protein
MRKTRVVLTENSNKNRNRNCKVYHPDGKLMFVNSEKKAKWYIEKTGAIILKEEDGRIKEIQLTFEPKGTGFEEDDSFGLSIQEFKCVVTGSSENLTRHHIIPYSYRKHMPIEYKSRNHHDVVLMTDFEHDKYERIVNKLKDDLHKRYNIPSVNEGNNMNLNKSICVKYMSRILGYIKAVSYANLPESKRKSMSNIILNYYNLKFNKDRKRITENLKCQLVEYLQEHIKDTRHNTTIDTHKMLVDKLISIGELDSFVIMWRQHFIDIVKPKYMPIGWKVDYKVKTDL